jgi:hypothetical protein
MTSQSWRAQQELLWKKPTKSSKVSQVLSGEASSTARSTLLASLHQVGNIPSMKVSVQVKLRVKVTASLVKMVEIEVIHFLHAITGFAS